VEGIGRHGRHRTAHFPDASVGLPLIIEIIDAPDSVDAFVPTVLRIVPGALVTREEVRIDGPGLASPS
jgi:PII-like signaling protein